MLPVITRRKRGWRVTRYGIQHPTEDFECQRALQSAKSPFSNFHPLFISRLALELRTLVYLRFRIRGWAAEWKYRVKDAVRSERGACVWPAIKRCCKFNRMYSAFFLLLHAIACWDRFLFSFSLVISHRSRESAGDFYQRLRRSWNQWCHVTFCVRVSKVFAIVQRCEFPTWCVCGVINWEIRRKYR